MSTQPKRRSDYVAWMPIEDHEGYFVSDQGCVRGPYKILRPRPRKGYLRVRIRDRDYSIHHLVAEAFVSPRTKERPEINHINGLKSDNRVVNLEWSTRSENMKHAVRTGLISAENYARGAEQHLAKLSDEKVRAIRLSSKTDRELAHEYGVHHTTIRAVRKRLTWRHV